jgi:predicted amidophosphoribosyltransferase
VLGKLCSYEVELRVVKYLPVMDAEIQRTNCENCQAEILNNCNYCNKCGSRVNTVESGKFINFFEK